MNEPKKENYMNSITNRVKNFLTGTFQSKPNKQSEGGKNESNHQYSHNKKIPENKPGIHNESENEPYIASQNNGSFLTRANPEHRELLDELDQYMAQQKEVYLKKSVNLGSNGTNHSTPLDKIGESGWGNFFKFANAKFAAAKIKKDAQFNVQLNNLEFNDGVQFNQMKQNSETFNSGFSDFNTQKNGNPNDKLETQKSNKSNNKNSNEGLVQQNQKLLEQWMKDYYYNKTSRFNSEEVTDPEFNQPLHSTQNQNQKNQIYESDLSIDGSIDQESKSGGGSGFNWLESGFKNTQVDCTSPSQTKKKQEELEITPLKLRTRAQNKQPQLGLDDTHGFFAMQKKIDEAKNSPTTKKQSALDANCLNLSEYTAQYQSELDEDYDPTEDPNLLQMYKMEETEPDDVDSLGDESLEGSGFSYMDNKNFKKQTKPNNPKKENQWLKKKTLKKQISRENGNIENIQGKRTLKRRLQKNNKKSDGKSTVKKYDPKMDESYVHFLKVNGMVDEGLSDSDWSQGFGGSSEEGGEKAKFETEEERAERLDKIENSLQPDEIPSSKVEKKHLKQQHEYKKKLLEGKKTVVRPGWQARKNKHSLGSKLQFNKNFMNSLGNNKAMGQLVKSQIDFYILYWNPNSVNSSNQIKNERKKDILFGQDLLMESSYTCLPGNHKLQPKHKMKNDKLLKSLSKPHDKSVLDDEFMKNEDFILPHDMIILCEPYKELTHDHYISIVSKDIGRWTQQKFFTQILLKKSKFHQIQDEDKLELVSEKYVDKTLFKVELSKRDLIHIKFLNVDFLKSSGSPSHYGVHRVEEIHIFCVYMSYSPKDGVKRRLKVLNHLKKWTNYLKKRQIPYLMVGDFNTNLSKLPTVEEFEQSRLDEGIQMGNQKGTPTFYLTEDEIPLLQSICRPTKIEDMLTQHGLTRRRKLKSGKRERSRIDYLLTSELSVGQVIQFEHEDEFQKLTQKGYELAKGGTPLSNFERDGKCEWINDSNMVSDHYAFRFRITSKNLN